MLRAHARRADEAVRVLRLAGLQGQAHPALRLLADGIRGDVRQAQPAHLVLSEGQHALHHGVRPHQPQLRVEDGQDAGGLGERPFPERFLPGRAGRVRRTGPARHGGHHGPPGVPPGRRPAVREQPQFRPTAVPVPQRHGAAPPLLPGRDPPRPVGGGIGEQVRGGQSHDLGGRVAEQPMGLVAPLGHDALLVDGGRGRVRGLVEGFVSSGRSPGEVGSRSIAAHLALARSFAASRGNPHGQGLH